MSCRSWKILPKKGLILLYRPIILVTHHSKKKIINFLFVLYPKKYLAISVVFFFSKMWTTPTRPLDLHWHWIPRRNCWQDGLLLNFSKLLLRVITGIFPYKFRSLHLDTGFSWLQIHRSWCLLNVMSVYYNCKYQCYVVSIRLIQTPMTRCNYFCS